MSKKALCVHRLAYPYHPLGPVMSPMYAPLLLSDVSLQDRATCETDTNYLQLLPYITAVHGNSVFMYSRGGQGGEGRLHGALSIGLGGHVEAYPGGHLSLEDLLKEEARREYLEEMGVPAMGPIEFTHTLYDPATEVGRVHLGLHCVVQASSLAFTPEMGAIEDGSWVPRGLLTSQSIYGRLEPWSKLVAMHLAPTPQGLRTAGT